jgi:hypothetical protein
MEPGRAQRIFYPGPVFSVARTPWRTSLCGTPRDGGRWLRAQTREGRLNLFTRLQPSLPGLFSMVFPPPRTPSWAIFRPSLAGLNSGDC